MKKIRFIPAGVLILLLSGCASTYGVLGIASKTYVDQRLNETDRKITSTEQQLAQTSQVNSRNYSDTLAKLTSLEDDVSMYEQRTQEIDLLIEEISRIKVTTTSLQTLADQVESRLDSIPRETLAELSRILQEYLEGGNEPPLTTETQLSVQSSEVSSEVHQ